MGFRTLVVLPIKKTLIFALFNQNLPMINQILILSNQCISRLQIVADCWLNIV